MLKKLEKYLDDKKAKYNVLAHKTVYTAMDKARTLKADPKAVIKSCFVKINPKNYAIGMISADKIVDFKKLKDAVNKWLKKQGIKLVRKIEFAPEKWMKKNLLGKVGANPPFGELYKIPTFVDKALLKNKKLIMNLGEYEESIEMALKDFNKIFDNCCDSVKAAISGKPVKKTKKKIVSRK